jgi:hypothetical protein
MRNLFKNAFVQKFKIFIFSKKISKNSSTTTFHFSATAQNLSRKIFVLNSILCQGLQFNKYKNDVQQKKSFAVLTLPCKLMKQMNISAFVFCSWMFLFSHYSDICLSNGRRMVCVRCILFLHRVRRAKYSSKKIIFHIQKNILFTSYEFH